MFMFLLFHYKAVCFSTSLPLFSRYVNQKYKEMSKAMRWKCVQGDELISKKWIDLDNLVADDVNWTPYTQHKVYNFLRGICASEIMI